MKQRFIFLVIILITGFTVLGQTDDSLIRENVLAVNVIDSLFIFGKWTEDGNTETQLRYLGNVTTSKGQILKIMNYSLIWGLSHRATNRILVYNNQNQYIGNYYLTTTDDLPDKLEDGFLVFTNIDNINCDKNLITRINLMNGLPNKIYIKCKGELGDIYSFE